MIKEFDINELRAGPQGGKLLHEVTARPRAHKAHRMKT